MSKIVKYDKVILRTDKRILTNDINLGNIYKKSLTGSDNQDGNLVYSDMIKKTKKHAEEIVANAFKEAEGIVTEGYVKAEEIKNAAIEEGQKLGQKLGYEDGYTKGLEEGRSLGKAEYDEINQEAMDLRDKFVKDYNMLYETSEKYMLDLSIEIAKKVLGELFEIDEKAFVGLVSKILQEVRGQKKIVLKVSGHDFPKVSQNRDYLLSKLAGVNDIDILEDAYLEKGSCIVDTENGVINGSVRNQMEIIESSLQKLVGDIIHRKGI